MSRPSAGVKSTAVQAAVGLFACTQCDRKFGSARALAQHRAAVKHGLSERKSRPAEEDPRSAVLRTVIALPGARLAEIAEALSAEIALVEGWLHEMLVQRTVVPVPLPDGEFGFRCRTTPVTAVLERLGLEDAKSRPFSLLTLEDIARLLTSAGRHATVNDGTSLLVEGVVVKPPSKALTAPEALYRWFDAYAAGEHLDLLERRTRECLDGLAPMLSVAVEDGKVVVLDGRPNSAVKITPVRASIRDGSGVFGNFLADGPHWFLLREELDAVCAEALPMAGRQLHRRFPDGTSPDVAEAAENASRRLAADRSLSFAHDIRVDVRDASLTFLPLAASAAASAAHEWWERRTAHRVEVRFRYERGKRTHTGALQLVPSGVPLPCDWHQTSNLETLQRAWSLALEVYAEMTCPSAKPPRPTGPSRTRASGQSRHQRASPAPSLRSPGAGSITVPTGFSPVGDTARYLGSYVAGHRRLLQLGHSHSSEAVANAGAVGIKLRGHETWVEPHVRGMPSQACLHFRWQGPKWLRK